MNKISGMNNDELMAMIDDKVGNYHGDISYLYEAIGMVVVGRLFGWRVMRLVSSGRCWTLACKLFGDLKEELLPEGKYYKKSAGMRLIDQFGDYWEIIKRHKSMPMDKRRMVGEIE